MSVFEDISDGGEPRVWIDINWAGVTKRSRDFKRANVNQIIYFKLLIPPKIKEDANKLENFL